MGTTSRTSLKRIMKMARIGDYTKKKTEVPASFTDWQAHPDDQTLSALFKDTEPVMTAALRSFGGSNEALKTRAKILAVEAFKSFDPTKGATLSTHLYNNLKSLNRYRAERDTAIHIPENIRLNAENVRRFQAEYREKNNEDPSDVEISDGLGISLKSVAKTRESGELPGSMMETEKGDLPGKPRDPQQVWMDYVYHDMDDKNRKIFQWTTGYRNSQMLAKKEIAKRLGISPAAVSLRINKIIPLLQDGLR